MTKTTIKWLKRAILVLAIIPILLFLGFAGAVSLIDFNQYKPQIEKEVAELTNREFKIEGAVEVSILPFMFQVGKMTMKNPEGFSKQDFLTMREARIELSLKQLFLEKKLKVISLELIEPKVHFIEKADRNNWSDMPFLAALNPGKTLAALQKAEQGSQVGGFMKVTSQAQAMPPVVAPTDGEDWSLESLVIKSADLLYTHEQQDFTVSLTQANLITFDVKPGRAFKINSDFIYQHSQSPRIFDFQINSQLVLANRYTQLHLSDWQGVFRLRLPEERNLPDIRLTTSGKNLMVDFKHQQIYVHQTVLKGLEAEVNMSFQGEFGVNPEFSGVFEAQKIDIKNWIEHLGLPAPEMANPKALTEAGGKFNWFWNGELLKLEKLEVQLDDSSITGQIQWPVNSDQPVMFDLAVDQFNADRYLVKADNNETFYPIPMSWLHEFNVQGHLTANSLEVSQLKAKQLTMDVSAENGELLLAPFDIAFEQGEMQSKLQASLSKTHAEYFWKGRIKQVDLQQFSPLTTLPVRGLLTSRFALQTNGNEAQTWAENLQGTVQADLEAAAIQGLDLNQLLTGQIELNSNHQASTQLESLKVVGQFEKGVFSPKRLTLMSERFKGSGKGQLDLNSEQIDGQLLVNIHNPAEALAELKGIVLPLTFQGDLTQPTWSIDLTALNPSIIAKSSLLSALKSLSE